MGRADVMQVVDMQQHPVVKAAASRDRLTLIDAMLDLLAERVVDAKAYESAQIVGRMQSLAKERAELGAEKSKVTVADDLIARRKARRAAAAASASAAGESQ